jgi:hypothetical protein
MLDSLILYFLVIWTTLLSVVVRAKQHLVARAWSQVVQAPKPQVIQADASPTLSFTTLSSTPDDKEEHDKHTINPMPALALAAATAAPIGASKAPAYPGGIKAYYQAKIEATELTINERTQNLRRLEAQRNALNARGTRFGSGKSGWG